MEAFLQSVLCSQTTVTNMYLLLDMHLHSKLVRNNLMSNLTASQHCAVTDKISFHKANSQPLCPAYIQELLRRRSASEPDSGSSGVGWRLCGSRAGRL